MPNVREFHVDVAANCNPNFALDPEILVSTMADSRDRLLKFVKDLSPEQLKTPFSETVNLLNWETGHVGYFFDAFIRILFLK